MRRSASPGDLLRVKGPLDHVVAGIEPDPVAAEDAGGAVQI
jgi:hypothetical protein